MMLHAKQKGQPKLLPPLLLVAMSVAPTTINVADTDTDVDVAEVAMVTGAVVVGMTVRLIVALVVSLTAAADLAEVEDLAVTLLTATANSAGEVMVLMSIKKLEKLPLMLLKMPNPPMVKRRRPLMKLLKLKRNPKSLLPRPTNSTWPKRRPPSLPLMCKSARLTTLSSAVKKSLLSRRSNATNYLVAKRRTREDPEVEMPFPSMNSLDPPSRPSSVTIATVDADVVVDVDAVAVVDVVVDVVLVVLANLVSTSMMMLASPDWALNCVDQLDRKSVV